MYGEHRPAAKGDRLDGEVVNAHRGNISISEQPGGALTRAWLAGAVAGRVMPGPAQSPCADEHLVTKLQRHLRDGQRIVQIGAGSAAGHAISPGSPRRGEALPL